MKNIFTYLLLLISVQLAFAQGWRSTLYPENWTPKGNFYTDKIIQDFSYAGYRRGEKSIPVVTVNIKDVTAAPYSADKTGATDVTAKIQQAINDVSAAGGGVVYLPAGTYKVNPGSNNYCLRISKSNVVLRGAGSGLTFILNNSYKMRNKTIISVQGNGGWYGTENNKTLITQNLTGPVRDIPVQSAAAYKVGDMVILRNYIGDAWVNEHKITQWLGQGSALRGFAFCREVTKVDYTKNIITVDSPIRYSLLTRDNSAVYKVTGMISEVGIEALSVGNVQNPATSGYGENDFNVAGKAAYDAHASYAITFNGVLNSWISAVKSYKPSQNTTTAHLLSNAVLLNYTKNVTVQNCHFQRPQYGGGGGNGYMYRITGNDNLIKSCIAEFCRHGFVFSHMSSSGNVIHKCSDIKTASATGNTGYYKTSGNGSDHHMHFSTSNLIDQCTTQDSYFAAGFRNYGSSPIHGITSAHTVYWNMTGNGTAYSKVVHTQQSRYGYAIGTSGNASAVVTGEFSLSGSASITAPVDHVEGQGQGATLQPQSLYLDQLAKRLTTGNPCTGNTAPVITLTSSAPSSAAPASLTLTATASDANGSVTKVDFYEGAVLVGSDVSAPYTCIVSGVSAGIHSYTAKAIDNCSAVTTSSAVSVTVSPSTNKSPVVSITSPTAQSFNEHATIPLAATAKDSDGSITKVEFYRGSTLIISDATTPYAYSWTDVAAGTYQISAKAYDNHGAVTTSAVVTVTVTGTTATVGISGPSCVEPGSSSTFTVTTEANASSAGWWANANVTITPDPVNYKSALVRLNSGSGSFTLYCGVNYSKSPYYKEYTKTIKIGGCSANRSADVIITYPADDDAGKVKLDGKTIDEVRVFNTKGQQLRTISNPSAMDEVAIPSDLPFGIYILHIVTDGEVISKSYIRP